MSKENVEVARAYYADIDRTLKAYWASSEVALSASAETQAIIERLHPEVVWKPPFRSADEGYRGPEGIRRALDELVRSHRGLADNGRGCFRGGRGARAGDRLLPRSRQGERCDLRPACLQRDHVSRRQNRPSGGLH